MALKIKLIILAVAVLGGGGFVWHYKSLRTEVTTLREDVLTYAANEKKLEQSLKDERTATAQAVSDRANTQRDLDKLRESRAADPESQAWAVTVLPVGERLRLCEALPEAKGCLNDE